MIAKSLISLLLFSVSLLAQNADKFDSSSKLIVMRCKVECVNVTHINVVNVDGLVDENGKLVEVLNSGRTELFVAEDTITLSDDEKKLFTSSLSTASEWDPDKSDSTGGQIVGLEVKSIDFMVSSGGKWTLWRLFSDHIMIFEAKLEIDRPKFKIFNGISGGGIRRISEDKHLIDLLKVKTKQKMGEVDPKK